MGLLSWQQLLAQGWLLTQSDEATTVFSQTSQWNGGLTGIQAKQPRLIRRCECEILASPQEKKNLQHPHPHSPQPVSDRPSMNYAFVMWNYAAVTPARAERRLVVNLSKLKLLCSALHTLLILWPWGLGLRHCIGISVKESQRYEPWGVSLSGLHDLSSGHWFPSQINNTPGVCGALAPLRVLSPLL